MIFITGPLYSGKREYVKAAPHLTQEELDAQAVWDVQDLAAKAQDLTALADTLAKHPIVIATEVGGGVVPVDRAQREAREAAGRLSCLLAQRATTVIRVFCGLPEVLKGEPL